MEFCLTGYADLKDDTSLKRLLKLCDREFVPPLSARNGTAERELYGKTATDFPYAYLASLKEQELLLLKEEDILCAFLSFRSPTEEEKHLCREGLYISTVIVDPAYRGKGLAEKLYRRLNEIYPQKALLTRTWSLNLAQIHVLEKLGFNEVLRKRDDRGKGIDTLYYLYANSVPE